MGNTVNDNQVAPTVELIDTAGESRILGPWESEFTNNASYETPEQGRLLDEIIFGDEYGMLPNEHRRNEIYRSMQRFAKIGIRDENIVQAAIDFNLKHSAPTLGEKEVRVIFQDFLSDRKVGKTERKYPVEFSDPIPGIIQRDMRIFSPHDSRVRDIFTKEPPAPRSIVQGLYPVATGQESAPGGSGKTTRKLFEAIHIITGRPLYGRPIAKPGGVLIVTREDDADIFRYRLHHIARGMGLSESEQRQVAQNLHILDLTTDSAARLVAVDRAGNLRTTDLAERIYVGYGGEGIVQVNFDPLNLFGPGERFVNDGEGQLMTAGAQISRELGANVCFVSHTSKAVARDGTIDQYAGRGGAALADNARFVLVYARHRPDDSKRYPVPAGTEQAAARGDLYRLHVEKMSYGAQFREPIWIERQGWSFLHHEGAPASHADRLDSDCRRVQQFVADELALGVKYQATTLAEQAGRFGVSRNQARMLIARLLGNGGLILRPLPEHEKSGRRTHYLEAIIPATDTALPADGDIFGEGEASR